MKLAARTILVAVTLALAAPAMTQLQAPVSGRVPPAIQRGDFGWQGRPPAQP